MTKKASKKTDVAEWDIAPEALNDTDPLLSCLVIICKLHDKNYSPEALSEGFPIENNRFTPTLFIRAADRAEMKAKIVTRDISDLHQETLPVVLLLKQQEACILLSVDEQYAQVINPSYSSGVQRIPLSTLKAQYTGHTLFCKPAYKFSERSNEALFFKKSRNWLWKVLWSAWPLYSEVMVASLLINSFALAVPLFVMNVYDRVVPNQAIETLWVLAIGVLIVFSFDYLMKTLRGYFIDVAGKNVDLRLSSKIFAQVLGLRMDVRPNSVGAFVNTVQSFEAFRDFITSTSLALLVDIPFVLIFIGVIALLGGSLAWIPFTAMFLVLLVGLMIQFPLLSMTKESFQHAAEKQAALIESIGGVETIKTQQAEGVMQRRWEHVTRLAGKLGIKLRFISNLGINFSIFAQQLSTVFIVIAGVYKISAGELTVGALIACTILTGRALAPMSQVARLMTRYQQSIAGLHAIDQVMNLPVERPFERSLLHRDNFEGSIAFNDVSFAYPNDPREILQKISLTITPGEHVGIVGRIGSGKTTLAKLILGLYQPISGQVLLDGTDIQQLDPADLRHHIGYVAQDVNLFYGSVKDNISFGSPHINDEKILKAAFLSGTINFTSQHPHGFDMAVGERGNLLSGGQRQTIAIARSLLEEPSIVIMDEPSNAMDDTSEAYFRRNLQEYIKNKTFLLITQKASMLSLVDRLIVVDNGKIVADGSKESVIKSLSEGKIKTTSIKP